MEEGFEQPVRIELNSNQGHSIFAYIAYETRVSAIDRKQHNIQLRTGANL